MSLAGASGYDENMSKLSESQLKLISDAALYLEKPSLLMEIANLAGKPLEFFTKGLDRLTAGRVEEAVGTALRTALSVAVYTVPESSTQTGAHVGASLVEENINNVGARVAFWHKLSVALTGSAGGLFGIAGLAVELPLTTTIMLRSIAAIAQEFGEDLSDADIRLQCLAVFCLGGPGRSDDAMESAYLTSRMGLQTELTMASRAAAGLTSEQLTAMIQKGTAPAIVNLISRVAARFNVAVTEKMIAQAIPILGAATGATINLAFMAHFNRVARYHFGLRRLEREYGVEVIQSRYCQAAGKAFKPGVEAL